MEPMTLGSPGGSPATNPSNYLPSFLMGESQTPSSPRNNTLSPNKGNRSISFASPTSPQDYNRSVINQKTLFGEYQQAQSPPVGSLVNYQNSGGLANYSAGTPLQSHNASNTGPPTQGLFDSLRQERNQVQTPSRGMQSQPQTHFGTPVATTLNASTVQPGQYNDSYIYNNSFNNSRAITSPLYPTLSTSMHLNTSNVLQCPPQPRYNEFWITVFGFPSNTTSMILQHFAQCGTIVDKVFPPENGNWVHLKYSSRLECDKALNYNEKIISNNIMIGVTQCKDNKITDKENLCENLTQTSKVRPLAQTAYNGAQNETAVVATPSAPQKSSGLMNKAMDLFFGW